jgi:hypothetical protein
MKALETDLAACQFPTAREMRPWTHSVEHFDQTEQFVHRTHAVNVAMAAVERRNPTELDPNCACIARENVATMH